MKEACKDWTEMLDVKNPRLGLRISAVRRSVTVMVTRSDFVPVSIEKAEGSCRIF